MRNRSHLGRLDAMSIFCDLRSSASLHRGAGRMPASLGRLLSPIINGRPTFRLGIGFYWKMQKCRSSSLCLPSLTVVGSSHQSVSVFPCRDFVRPSRRVRYFRRDKVFFSVFTPPIMGRWERYVQRVSPRCARGRSSAASGRERKEERGTARPA